MRKYDWSYVAKVCLSGILGIAVVVTLLFFLLSTKEKETTVTGCVAEGNYYVVYVVDDNGDEYAYYDSDYIYAGTKISCIFHGNEILETKLMEVE